MICFVTLKHCPAGRRGRPLLGSDINHVKGITNKHVARRCFRVWYQTIVLSEINLWIWTFKPNIQWQLYTLIPNKTVFSIRILFSSPYKNFSSWFDQHIKISLFTCLSFRPKKQIFNWNQSIYIITNINCTFYDVIFFIFWTVSIHIVFVHSFLEILA